MTEPIKFKDHPLSVQEVVLKFIEDKNNIDEKTLLTLFTFEDTKERHSFWFKVNNGDYTEFFRKYPRKYYGDYPKEIQDIIKKRIEEQGNIYSPETYHLTHKNSVTNTGFTWRDTEEGFSFWYDLFEEGNLNAFNVSLTPSVEGTIITNNEIQRSINLVQGRIIGQPIRIKSDQKKVRI